MNERVKIQLDLLNSKEYRKSRISVPYDPTDELKDALPIEETAREFVIACDREEPVFYGDDIFGFNRLHSILPKDRNELKIPGSERRSGNMIVDYKSFLE